MGYLGKIESILNSGIIKPLTKAKTSTNATKQLYGDLIGTSKNGIKVFRQVAKDAVTTTSFKNGKMFKQIQQFTRTGNDAKTIVKNFSKGTITNIFHTFENGEIVRTLYKYISDLNKVFSSGANKDVLVKVYKNGLSLTRLKKIDYKMDGVQINTLRKGKDVLGVDFKFFNNGNAQKMVSDIKKIKPKA